MTSRRRCNLDGQPLSEHDQATLDAFALRLRAAGTDVWRDVIKERIRAHNKHGATSMEAADPLDATGLRLRVLTEELGEVAREFNDAAHEVRPVHAGRLRAELIQLAAMAGAWADALTTLAREDDR